MTDLSNFLSFPRIPSLKIPIIENPNLANVFYDRLRHHIEETEKQLEPNYELLIYYYPPGG